MEDLNHIRKRIKNRRFTRQEERPKKFTFLKLFYRSLMLLMGLCMVVLAILINQKLNVVKMPSVFQNFRIEKIANWIPFENWFSLKEEAVSATPSYRKLQDHAYSNGSNIAYNVYDGIVLHVEKTSGSTSISIKQDNGVISTYGNLKEVSLKSKERVLKGRPIGIYSENVQITFMENQKEIDLDAALQNNKN